MRIPHPEWLAALRQSCGDHVRLSYNETVGRWQFDVLCVDGQYRPQFYCWTRDPKTGAVLEADAFGFLPFRDLDDAGLREVIRNLERSYLANPADGPGSPHEQVRRAEAYNRQVWRQKHHDAAGVFADMAWDRKRQLRGDAFSAGGLAIVSPVGSTTDN